MTDEIKTDAEKAFNDIKADIEALPSEVGKAKSYVTAHMTALIAVVALCGGIYIGYLITHLHR